MAKYFYITTTLPYVNAKPHVGFALEIVQADALARAKKLQGYEVFFNTGTDEHGQKIAEVAAKEGKDPQSFTDFYAEKFRSLKELLNLYEDIHFIRTTDEHHVKAVQEFWKRCQANDDIYKATYKVKYCIGCELEKTDSELVDGKCPIHPNMTLEVREEENYFFKYSKYEKSLLDLYNSNPTLVVPDFRFNEIKEFVKRGLQDFSISRPKSKLSWGVPVPGDGEHVMYVWFDALVNYISTLGWPHNKDNFDKFWPGMQVAGKDQIRMQAGMWQAMLQSAGLPNTSIIFIHGFINSGGQKMSKSLGNVIDPVELVEEYGVDALRYFLLREIHPYEDSDFTMERFKEAYNANLANGIGNLTSRIMKMAETHLDRPVDIPAHTIMDDYFALYETFELNKVMDYIWERIGELDRIIQEKEPFKLIKTDRDAGVVIISDLVTKLYDIARLLNPVMPSTSDKIKAAVEANKMPAEPLFVRKD